MVIHSSARLWEEVAYVAYHFHWPFDAIVGLEHPVRQRLVREIARLNRAAGG